MGEMSRVADRFLLDTDVLIDFFRRQPEAVRFMDSLRSRPFISPVTVAELFSGVREGQERTNLEDFVLRSAVVELDEMICARAGLTLRQYRKSHGIGLADAMIAATAEVVDATLVTLNEKHFPMQSKLLVPYRKP